MATMKDETGKRYGMLTVLRRYNSDRQGVNWLCCCDCGQEIIVRGMQLRNANTRSCGCYRRMSIPERVQTGLLPHGRERVDKHEIS